MSKKLLNTGLMLMALASTPTDAKAGEHYQLPLALSLTGVFVTLVGAGALGHKFSKPRNKNTPKND